MFSYLCNTPDAISRLPQVASENVEYPIVISDANHNNEFYCEYHGPITNPSPLRKIYSSSYNPNTGEFTTSGTVVLGCPYCQRPIFKE